MRCDREPRPRDQIDRHILLVPTNNAPRKVHDEKISLRQIFIVVRTTLMSSQPVIRRRTPKSQRRRDGLIQYAHSVHSQNGEDGILAYLFDVILPPPLPPSPLTHRWCVDVGAWDGQHLSNTHQLLLHSSKKDQWRGVLLEADKEKFSQLKARYEGTENICLNVMISTSSTEDPHNLCNVLLKQDNVVVPQRQKLPKVFDFLCIDIDGSDYWVWHDLLIQQEYYAKVVCIEFNPTMPQDLIYIPPRDDEQRHGASLAALVELAQDHDYVLVETTLYNAFFVQRPLYEQYLQDLVPDTSMEALHETTMGTSLYQLYDGTIKLWGCKKLLWHRMALDENKLQVLPEKERKFPFAPPRVEEEEEEEEDADALSQWSDQAVDLSPFLPTYNSNTGASEEEQRGSMISCQASSSLLLLNQLEKDGFALVRGTGIDPHTCRAALDASRSFLQDADEAVRRSCLSPTDRARRGYAPANVENFASLLPPPQPVVGQPQPPQPNDLVRKFRIGPVETNTTGNNSNSSDSKNHTSLLLQPNIWPLPEVWDEADTFRSSVESYYQSAGKVATMVMRAIRQGLVEKYPELESALKALDSSSSNGNNSEGTTTTSILTLLGYRAGTRHKGKNKAPLVAAHTDVGVITLLLFDGGSQTCAGLQRKEADVGTEEGGGGSTNSTTTTSWVDVELPARIPSDPIFVINVADCLSDLSAGRLPSTIHRVIAKRQSSTIPRNCLALFVGLDPQCLLSFSGGGDEMTYEEWRRRRIERSQTVLKSARQFNPTVFHSSSSMH